MAQIQAIITKDAIDPWEDVCCKSCWFAQGKRCTCRCGGTYHGAGNSKGNEYFVKKRKRIREHVTWGREHYKAYPSAQRYKKLITDPHCHCGYDLSKEPVLAYNHTAGWEIEESDELQWLWITCPKCGYDMSLWKIGVPRNPKILLEAS